MPNIENLRSVKTLVCHANCPDGLASAMILKDVFPDAEIVFMQYNTPELAALKVTEGMLFCDFSPPSDRYLEFIAAGTIVLDHHKSAKITVEEFGDNGIFADEKEEPGVSGALLAFRHVWAPLRAKDQDASEGLYGRILDFAELAGIRDTWQRQHPRWEEACAQAEALLFWPKERWFLTNPWNWRELCESIGPTLLLKQAEKIEKTIKKGFRFTSHGGKRVIVFQGVSSTSDAAEKLGEEADLVVGFKYECDSEGLKVVYSLRSHTGFDCSKMAKENGGGGHTAAAGFAYRFAVTHDPYFLFEMMLAAHEHGRRWQ